MSQSSAKMPAMAKATPKSMSSRLLTMKFMQRSAGSNPASPASPSPVSAKTEPEESLKRRKTSHSSTPTTPVTHVYDTSAIRAALEEEEKKREAAMEKRAAELGDEHWVSDQVATGSRGGLKTLNVVQVGFAQIDSTRPDQPQTSADMLDECPKSGIRRFNMKKSMAGDGEGSRSSEDSDSSEEVRSESEDGHAPPSKSGAPQARGRQTSAFGEARKRARSSVSAQKEQSEQLANKRRKKEAKPKRSGPPSKGNKPQRVMSISAAGGWSGRSNRPPPKA